MTGTTFDRPQLKQMLADAENGEISTIIVKDLSRFGRLSGMVGYYVSHSGDLIPGGFLWLAAQNAKK